MNIFKEAKLNKQKGMGYRTRRFKLIWQNKNISWNWLAIEYGIRWSKKWQLFPIRYFSNNGYKTLTFGIWLLYFSVVWNKK